MTLSPGLKLGPYRIEALIGAGGMGEVYRATDTRLDRTVAIKVLAPDVAADPAFRDRFEREAKTISALDHPHICTLYDVGRERLANAGEGVTGSESVEYLVMQYLEGETLADRLARARPKSDRTGRTSSGETVSSGSSPTPARGPIPLDHALRYARQMAEALEAAHHHGIVHRDLKPGNVMLARSGAAKQGSAQVKLLDFGLAKVGVTPAPFGSGTFAPTQSAPLTGKGEILGTLQYMSPEQLEGRPADARSDIFAFGAILFEMLTGKRAFDGNSHAGVIAAILDTEPPALDDLADLKRALPGAANRALGRLLRKCLAKDPGERWQCAADLADELKWIDEERLHVAAGLEDGAATARATPDVVVASRRRARWWMAASAVAGAFAIGFVAWNALRPSPVAEAIRFSILPPERQSFVNGPAILSVSPDGRRVVFATIPETGQLWVRALDSLTAQPLPGSEGGRQPFWSPDGRSVAFVAGGEPGTGAATLKVVDLAGGPPLTLGDVGPARGAWSPGGVILIGGPGGKLYRIPERGGSPVPVTELDPARQETAHAWPFFLPDGRRFIFLARSIDPSKTALFLASLDSTTRTRLVDVHSSVEYAQGYLLYQREGTLMAHPFDERRGALRGDPSPIVENVIYNPATGRAAFSVSSTGVLAYRAGSAPATNTLRWIDRTGKEIGRLAGAGAFRQPRLSPDGRRVAVEVVDDTLRVDLWLIDLERDVRTRFTFDPATDSFPVWSPDGAAIVFRSDRKKGGVFDLYQRATGGAADEDVLLFESPEPKRPMSFSPDGKILLFDRDMGPGKGWDIWALPMTGDRKPFPVVTTPFNEQFAVFSPDGRWIAYDSRDSGVLQVYAQPFPPTGTRVQLSTTSGDTPAWSGNGKTIFFYSVNRIVVVDVTVSNGELHPGLPQTVIPEGRVGPASNFAVDSSGQRLLIVSAPEDRASLPITVVLNWTATLARK